MTDDIEDLELRKALADAQLAYWNECHREAARLHPNWEIAGEGVTLRHNGKRTGPSLAELETYLSCGGCGMFALPPKADMLSVGIAVC